MNESINEKVLQKLAKIKAHHESAKEIGSEAEAHHFAQMLNQLLLKHNLEMTDLEYANEIQEEPVEQYPVGGQTTVVNGKRVLAEYPDIEIKQKRIKWVEDLARMIARAHSCRLVVSHSGSSRVYFVGRRSNVAIAEYMWITMYRTIENLSWKEYKTARNKTKWEQIKGYSKSDQSGVEVDYSDLAGYRNSWINGFISRLREILEANRKRQEEATGPGTALLRLDKDQKAADNWIDAHTVKAKGLSRSFGGNSAGYAAGKAKADEVGMTAKGVGRATNKGVLGN